MKLVVIYFSQRHIKATYRRDNPVLLFVTDGSDGKYRIHREGIYEPYFLTVNDLQYSDRGSYYCCLPSNCSDSVEGDCQRFVLRIRGKVSLSFKPKNINTQILLTGLHKFFINVLGDHCLKSQDNFP